MRMPRKLNPRTQYREQRRALIAASPSLAESFTQLKSLTVDLIYHGAGPAENARRVRCTFNLESARSMFCFDCDNAECVGGDFDLSQQLAAAVAERRSSVDGQVICEGWHNRKQIDQRKCHHRLHYKFTLAYRARQPARAALRTTE